MQTFAGADDLIQTMFRWVLSLGQLNF